MSELRSWRRQEGKRDRRITYTLEGRRLFIKKLGYLGKSRSLFRFSIDHIKTAHTFPWEGRQKNPGTRVLKSHVAQFDESHVAQFVKSHIAQSPKETCSSAHQDPRSLVQKSHRAQLLRAQQLSRPCSPDLNKHPGARILKFHVA